ncbi:MAG TPA: glycosyltransferase family 87 protein [Candidatus Koribacter sp.]|jgi:hypothetical protein
MASLGGESGQAVRTAEAKAERGGLPKILREYWLTIVALTIVDLVLSYWLHGDILLFDKAHHFGDMVTYADRFHNDYGTAAFFRVIRGKTDWTYPAPIAVLLHLYYKLPHPIVAWIVTLVIVVAVGTVLFARAMERRGISRWTAWGFALTAAVTAYPVWYLVECANMEVYVLVFVGIGLACYLRGQRGWAAVCFGIATALKITPIIYCALLLNRRDWRKMLYGLAVGAAVFFGSHWMMGPTTAVALEGTRDALRLYTAHLVLGFRPHEVSFDHSLFGICKQMYELLRIHFHWESLRLPVIYDVYLPVVALLGVGLWVFRIRKLSPLSQAVAITVCAMLFTPVSWDYRLTHLYVPWMFVVLWVLEHPEVENKLLPGMFLFFAVLFTPQNYFRYRLMPAPDMGFFVDYAGQVRAVVLAALLVMVLWRPVGERQIQNQNL